MSNMEAQVIKEVYAKIVNLQGYSIEECSVNGEMFFGLSRYPYAWTDVAKKAGVSVENEKSAFVYLQKREDVLSVLRVLLNEYGFLKICK